MLVTNLAAQKNPYFLTTLVTVSAGVGFIIAKYAQGSLIGLMDLLVFAVVFWVIFFLGNNWIVKGIQKTEQLS